MASTIDTQVCFFSPYDLSLTYDDNINVYARLLNINNSIGGDILTGGIITAKNINGRYELTLLKGFQFQLFGLKENKPFLNLEITVSEDDSVSLTDYINNAIIVPSSIASVFYIGVSNRLREDTNGELIREKKVGESWVETDRWL